MTQALFDQLEKSLSQMIEQHRQLLDLIHEKVNAMSQGHASLVVDCCQRESDLVLAIGETEKKRQQIVAEITRMNDPLATELLTITQVADLAISSQRERFIERYQALKLLMAAIQTENGVAREATEGLLHHVHGVMQTMRQVVHSQGGYQRHGHKRTEAGAVIAGSFSTVG